jgi:hypothetical protein
MEQSKHTWDSASKKVLNEAGVIKAPANLMPSIMDSIAKAGLHHIQYKPLLSKRTLLFIVLGAVAVFSIIIMAVPVEKYYLDGVNLSIGERIAAFFGAITLSKPVLYGLGFLGLFLVQIPFLKRIIDN